MTSHVFPDGRRALVALLLFGLLVAGCALQQNRKAEATVLAERYLAAVAGGTDDRGWSLLHPDARRDMCDDSVDRYVSAVLASDWSEFRFSIESVVPDDPSLYFVRVRTDPPRFLVQPWDGNLWVLADAQDGTATMSIRFEPFASGVWPNGG